MFSGCFFFPGQGQKRKAARKPYTHRRAFYPTLLEAIVALSVPMTARYRPHCAAITGALCCAVWANGEAPPNDLIPESFASTHGWLDHTILRVGGGMLTPLQACAHMRRVRGPEGGAFTAASNNNNDYDDGHQEDADEHGRQQWCNGSRRRATTRREHWPAHRAWDG